jgi:hypothetical protein
VAASGSSNWGQRAETGNGSWTAVNLAGPSVVDANRNIILRTAQSLQKFTGYEPRHTIVISASYGVAMHNFIRTGTLVALATIACSTALLAQLGHPINGSSGDPISVAVFGDWPYSLDLKDSAHRLIDSVNADQRVRFVLHVGDIHSGSMPCTGAGLSPRPATSVATGNADIYNLFQQFKDPVVYTPGDNEWTDCHKTKEFTSGAPLLELAAVRQQFFASPGRTLGSRTKAVISQATDFDPLHPADAQFVENVRWEESQVVFVTMNVPGSNDDHLPWSGGTTAVPGAPYPAKPFLNESARAQEASQRDAANLRWLGKAFALADADNAEAIVIAIQADMFDPAAAVAGGDGLDGYDTFVQTLADLARAFGKPVLLINGDSHVYGADAPLSAAFYADPATVGDIHHVGFPVPNVTRITVQGSTTLPHEWLRLTIDPRSAHIFSWVNVPYCTSDPCSF